VGADWQPIVKGAVVAAKPTGLWTMVHEFVRGPAELWVTATGRWYYSEDKSCGPDGDLNALIARTRCLFPKAPVGALIGKVGGSSAGFEDGTLFLAGANCVFDVGGAAGPLYFTINDEYTGMLNNRNSLVVEVSQRNAEQAASGPAAAEAKPAAP
jgi:hypothetical protein